MAVEKKKPSKSESLTIRLDPKTRFILEFMSRLNGQTITTIVERAIVDAANNATVHYQHGDPQTWQDFWHVSDGVRALRVAGEPKLYPTYEEARLADFAERHRDFFYAGKQLRPTYIDILWPRIDEFLSLWSETKATDFWAVGKAMATAIRTAGIEPPVWPPKPDAPSKPAAAATSKYAADLDDDIPF